MKYRQRCLARVIKKLLAFYHDCFAVALTAPQQRLALLTETKTSTKPHGRGRCLYDIMFFTRTVSTVICAFLALALFKTLSISLPAFSLQGLCLQVVCGQGTGEEGLKNMLISTGIVGTECFILDGEFWTRNARGLLHANY